MGAYCERVAGWCLPCGGARLLVHAMHEAEARELLKQVFPEPE